MIIGAVIQILVEATANNNTVVLYTVPEGKEFMLFESMIHPTTISPGLASMEIRDDLDAHVRHINQLVVETQIGIIGADHFTPSRGLVLPEGYDIAITTDAAGLSAEGDIFGWEIG